MLEMVDQNAIYSPCVWNENTNRMLEVHDFQIISLMNISSAVKLYFLVVAKISFCNLF